MLSGKEDLELLDKIAADEIPVDKHRVRLLIYPQWAYDTYRSDVDQLIRSHSAARIQCIPLAPEELYRRLHSEEREAVKSVVNQLGQTVIGQVTTRPSLSTWFIKCRLRRGKKLNESWSSHSPTCF